MKLTFYGAARTVTGSQHMVEVNGSRILLDCGLYQGKRAEAAERNRNLPFDAAAVDVMVLSHAHIDHSGNIPNLIKSGYRGDIVCTPATRDLCAVMLLDSAHIHERDAEYVNKDRRKRGRELVQPLYTQQDALKCLDYFVTQSYGRTRTIAPGVQLTFLDAGHMLGSAVVVLDVKEQSSGRQSRLVFSGDLGRVGIPIIRDPQTIERADLLILESTYGDRVHDSYPDAERELERIVTETYRRGGSVVIPAFAVGRTQQLVYSLHQLAKRGDIPPMPVYVDSPLAVNATGVFRLHPECYDDEIRSFMVEDDRPDPFGFGDLTYVRSLEESKQLNFKTEPSIIISASGMAEFGRILHHLKNRIEDPRTTVLIVGWQAPDTLGRRLVEKQPVVKIFGESYQNKAHVEVLNGFSGHADQNELMAWVGAIQRKPDRVFLVHGEEPAALSLALGLKQKYALTVDVPNWKDSFEVN